MYEGKARVDGGGETVFYVSDEDAAWVKLYKWRCNKFGYIYRCTSRYEDGRKRSHNVFLHREVAGLERGDPMQGDHLNFDRVDCCRENVEIKTALENQRRQRQFGAK